jgi:hypothetical protein
MVNEWLLFEINIPEEFGDRGGRLQSSAEAASAGGLCFASQRRRGGVAAGGGQSGFGLLRVAVPKTLCRSRNLIAKTPLGGRGWGRSINNRAQKKQSTP